MFAFFGPVTPPVLTFEFADAVPAGINALASSASVRTTARPTAEAPGGLRRGADWGFRLVPAGDGRGAEVRRLVPGSVAAAAGLAENDRVLEIEGRAQSDERSIATARRAHRGGDRVRLVIERAGARQTVELVLPALPFEESPGSDVVYGSVRTARGYRVRTIVSRPIGAKGRLPAVLFVPWLSAAPIETPTGRADGWTRLLRALPAESGWVLMRVEKPGVGDSEGPEPWTNDLETDLDAYRAALGALRRTPGVDSSRIVLLGASIGGALAPVLAREQPVAGLVVSGCFSRTWFEHMLEIERRRLTLEGRAPGEVNRLLQSYAELYALYLGQRLTPEEVVARRPDLAPLWQDAPDGQYGRPAAYYHQVARLNVEEAWSQLDVPVLALYGEYDWIMSRAEHEHVVALVNARRPGRAMLAVLPRTGHDLDTFATPEDSFHDRSPGFDDGVIERVAGWLRSLAK